MRCSLHAVLTRLGLVAAIAAVAISGCNGGSGGYPTQINANVRVVNAIPDSGTIDVFLQPVQNVNSGGNQSTTTVVSGLPFQGLTSYISVPEGPQTLQVGVAGGATFVVDENINLIGLKNYTLYLFGPSSSVLALPMLDNTQNTGSGQFEMSVTNGAFGTLAADVYILPSNVSVDDTTPAYTGVGYGLTAPLKLLNSGTFSIRLTALGSKIVLYDSGPVTFAAAATYQLFIYTKSSSSLLNAMLLTSGGTGAGSVINSTIAQFKLTHVAPGTGPVNAFVESLLIFANLPYLTATSYALVPTGSRAVTIALSSLPGVPLTTVTPAFSPATDTSVVLTGPPGAQTAFALADNNSPGPVGTASVRFVNASLDLGPVDVYVNFVQRASSLATNTQSPYILLPAADTTAPAPNTYTINFNYAGTSTVALSVPAFAVNAGRTYTLYLAGPANQLASVQTQDR